jgi:hypothetical protein
MIDFKVCNKCGIEKDVLNFSLKKDSKDGYNTICKKCKSDYEKNNRENINLRRKKYNKLNKDRIKQHNKTYYKKNKEVLILNYKKYNLLNKDKIKKHKLKYVLNNKDKVNNAKKNWRLKNPHTIAWRNVLKSCLQRMGKIKEAYTIDLLGYSAIELKKHIESLFTEGMSWDNYGEWHIDHIKPVIKFDKNELPSVVNTLENLRPMWATTREINGVTYIGNLNKNKY